MESLIQPAHRKVATDIMLEYVKARMRHDPMHSGHEGYAVIKEELDELWEEIRKDNGSSNEARKEAIQIAAMAFAYVLEICGE